MLLPVLKAIWFGAFQPCGTGLHALLPEWVPAYEEDRQRIDADVGQALLSARSRTGPLAAATARCRGSGEAARGRVACCAKAFRSAASGQRKSQAGWNWVRSRCAAPPSTICISGCSIPWIFGRTGPQKFLAVSGKIFFRLSHCTIALKTALVVPPHLRCEGAIRHREHS